MEFFGIRFVGFTPENGRRLLLTLVIVVAVWAASKILRFIARKLARGATGKRVEFWTKQVIHLVAAVVVISALLSIWFTDPGRLTTFLGLFSAGLAFAMQRVVTALAGYFMLLRGSTFNVGDRIKMASVRGDVVALGFFQTTIMEMGQPPAEQSESPGMWVEGRQYTGRIVTITNDKIFEEPVYNYSREFPFIWEEMRVGVSYTADHAKAEQILLRTAKKHTEPVATLGEKALAELERRYFMQREDLEPRVFWRMTDNWLELSLRFITRDTGVRGLKDQMTREILKAFDEAGLEIASGTYEIVGMPELRVKMESDSPRERGHDGHESRRFTSPRFDH